MISIANPRAVTEPDATAAGSRGGPELCVVVPTFNERDNVDILIQRLDRALQGIDWEVVFVDDDSPDGTARHVRALAERDRRTRCIRRIGRLSSEQCNRSWRKPARLATTTASPQGG